MSFESLIEKAVAKTGDPIKLKRRNAQPEAIEQAKVVAWARANENNYPYLWMLQDNQLGALCAFLAQYCLNNSNAACCHPCFTTRIDCCNLCQTQRSVV